MAAGVEDNAPVCLGTLDIDAMYHGMERHSIRSGLRAESNALRTEVTLWRSHEPQ